jgi:hypothetical protein
LPDVSDIDTVRDLDPATPAVFASRMGKLAPIPADCSPG